MPTEKRENYKTCEDLGDLGHAIELCLCLENEMSRTLKSCWKHCVWVRDTCRWHSLMCAFVRSGAHSAYADEASLTGLGGQKARCGRWHSLLVSRVVLFCFRPQRPVLTEECVSVGPIPEQKADPLPPRSQVISRSSRPCALWKVNRLVCRIRSRVSHNKQVKTKLIWEKG